MVSLSDDLEAYSKSLFKGIKALKEDILQKIQSIQAMSPANQNTLRQIQAKI